MQSQTGESDSGAGAVPPGDSRGDAARTGAADGDAPQAAPAPLSQTLYRELRALAGHYLRMERIGHTLQPTALVNEAFLRMRERLGSASENRREFVALAALVMRRVLVDHARATKAMKRGGGSSDARGSGVRIDLDSVAIDARSDDMLCLDEALEKLEALDPRHARVVELRFFGGLSVSQTAEILEVSERTVEADWALARAWLRREMGTPKSQSSAEAHP